jgi:hypothetical protein
MATTMMILRNTVLRRAVFAAAGKRIAPLSTTATWRKLEADSVVDPVYHKHKLRQKAYRMDDGDMNFIKGPGMSKTVLWTFTLMLMALGTYQFVDFVLMGAWNIGRDKK